MHVYIYIKIIFIASFVFWKYPVAFSDAKLREYPCHKLEAEPVLDGKAENDPAWTNIPEADGFVKSLKDSGTLSARDSRFKMGWTEECLYLCIVCLEPHLDRSAGGKEDWTRIWLHDSVEIFIKPEKSENYFQFLINLKGARASYIVKKNHNEKLPLDLWEAETFKGNDYFSLEVKIPLKTLGLNPHEDKYFRGNLCRNIITVYPKQFSTWAFLEQSAHAPELFAEFSIMKNAGSKSALEKEEKNLKDDLKRHISTVYFSLTQRKLDLFSEKYEWLLKKIATEDGSKTAEGFLKEFDQMKNRRLKMKNMSVLDQDIFYKSIVCSLNNARSFLIRNSKNNDSEKGRAILKTLF